MNNKKTTHPLLTQAIRPLPDALAQRYGAWYHGAFQDAKADYQHLADFGQQPQAIVISCCDSRVNAVSLLGGKPGDFFSHRNIANLVPPFQENGAYHGTAAAIEYAIAHLRVAQVIILGHSGCGGIKAAYAIHSGNNAGGDSGGDSGGIDEASFLHKWLQIIKPAYENAQKSGDDATRIRALEKASILHSLNNLLDYPFVAEAVKAGRLSLHGLWHDIGTGQLYAYDSEAGEFVAVAV